MNQKCQKHSFNFLKGDEVDKPLPNAFNDVKYLPKPPNAGVCQRRRPFSENPKTPYLDYNALSQKRHKISVDDTKAALTHHRSSQIKRESVNFLDGETAETRGELNEENDFSKNSQLLDRK